MRPASQAGRQAGQHPAAAASACMQSPSTLQTHLSRRAEIFPDMAHTTNPHPCLRPSLRACLPACLPAFSVRCWAVAAGVVMFTSELLLAGSLLTFEGQRVMKAAKQMAAPSLGTAADLRGRLLNTLVLAMLYVPVRTALYCTLLHCSGGCCRMDGRTLCHGSTPQKPAPTCPPTRPPPPLPPSLTALPARLPCRAVSADARILCRGGADVHGAASRTCRGAVGGRPVCVLLTDRLWAAGAHWAARVACLSGLAGGADGALPARLAG